MNSELKYVEERLYTRCLFLVAIYAEEGRKEEFPITRGRLSEFINHACNLQNCELSAIYVGSGFVLFLVDLDAGVSIGGFLSNLKYWTSGWITGQRGEKDNYLDYWTWENYVRTVSPQDKGTAINFVASAAAYNGNTLKIPVNAQVRNHQPAISFCHHIIIVTSRSRLLLPLKYRDLLAQMLQDVAVGLGATVEACASMRNHMHLMCLMPASESVATFIDKLKTHLLDNMHSSRHFHKFDGWSDNALAFTVSASRHTEEEHDILIQDLIHPKFELANEMYYLYRKMGITYVTSLH